MLMMKMLLALIASVINPQIAEEEVAEDQVAVLDDPAEIYEVGEIEFDENEESDSE